MNAIEAFMPNMNCVDRSISDDKLGRLFTYNDQPNQHSGNLYRRDVLLILLTLAKFLLASLRCLTIRKDFLNRTPSLFPKEQKLATF